MEEVAAQAARRFTILDIFGTEELQRLQDAFADAAGVASIITDTEGNPITRESNYTDLCRLIRSTEIGAANCRKSDAVLGRGEGVEPSLNPCLSCGIWDAGTPIRVGGFHVANWLIGQVRSEETDPGRVIAYAREIGAPPEPYERAFSRLPVMSLDRFRKIAASLRIIADDLSARAYNQVKQKELFREWARSLKALEASENHNRALLTALPDLTILFDRRGTMLDIKEGDQVKPLVPPSLAISKHFSEILPPDVAELTEQKLALLFRTGIKQEYDYRLTVEGEQRHFECRMVPSGSDEALAVIRDVTDLRNAFAEIRKSLGEKELLVKELFHRTKNNMQLIRSLISLQAGSSGSPEVAEALTGVEARILSMSVVHQFLYTSGDPSRIRLDEYLRELLFQLRHTCHEGPGEVEIELSCDPVMVMLDIATPFGLIINELVLNSFRHAFSAEGGTITISVREREEDRLIVQYADSGQGPSGDFSLESAQTLGLTTVKILVDQLGGTISSSAGPGLRYTMELINGGYRERL